MALGVLMVDTDTESADSVPLGRAYEYTVSEVSSSYSVSPSMDMSTGFRALGRSNSSDAFLSPPSV